MPNTFIPNRAKFKKGGQALFMRRIQAAFSISALAQISGYSERTIRCWREEKYHMPESVVQRFSRMTKIPPPSYSMIDARVRAKASGKLGGAALIRKYGRIPADESYRKERWNEWWKRDGSRSLPASFIPKDIRTPRKSVELAEFAGIMMGDGGMSRYQAIISLNSRDDAAYTVFVVRLVRKLFRVTPAVYRDKSALVNDIVISRRKIVEYLHALGLPIGNKIRQGLDMPQWVRQNPAYAIACVRGLMDTDGCVFTHSYRVNGKRYSYKKIAFTSASPLLVASVSSVLRGAGLSPRIARGGRDVRIDRVEEVRRYFQLVGTHNPKHLKRYRNRVG
jgi:hypothetical protein